MTIISVKNLSVFYGKEEIVKNINLDIEENKITAIIGPSGCGKSTFLSSINRIIEEMGGRYEGIIKLHDKDIKEMKKEILRQKIGMVFQKPTPFPLSILENISLPLKYHKIPHKERSIEVLKRVGLYEEIKDSLNKKASKLSGGQQQRLSIARSLAVYPEVILLDEPCSSLDVENTKKIEKLLKDLKSQVSIVIVTHNLAQAKRIADTIVQMEAGKILKIGKSSEFNFSEELFF